MRARVRERVRARAMALQTQSGAQKFAEKLQLHEAAYCELERAI